MRSVILAAFLLISLHAQDACAAGIPPAGPGTVVPADFGLPTPDPEPPLPPGFDVFEPPAPTVTGMPAIAEASRTAGPGELFVASGVGLDDRSRFLAFSQTTRSDASLAHAVPWAADGLAAAAALPEGTGSWSMYLIWPEAENGRGPPVALNRTDAWWAGPQPARPGQVVALYGRNLSHDNGTSAAWVYIKPPGGGGSWAAVVSVSPYRVAFRIPDGLPPGTYEAWAHNGHGGRFGWSGPVALPVGPSPWAGQDSRIYDVSAFGARGDGRTDDQAAIQAALAEAGVNAPATVRFPRGTYLVSRGFVLPDGVRLLGDGPDLTVIKATPGFLSDPGDSRGQAMLFANGSYDGNDVEIARLTLDGTEGRGHTRVPVFLRYARNVRITDVRIRSGPEEYFNLDGIRGLFLTDVELTGKGGFLGAASQVFIADSHVLLTRGASAAFSIWGGHEIALTGNRIADLDPQRTEQSSAGRFLVSQPHFGSVRDIYIAGNVTSALAPPPAQYGDPNAGEQILFEQCCAVHTGAVAAATPTTLTLEAPLPVADLANGMDAIVVAGPGVGQYRRITAVDPQSRTLEVSPPWRVVPAPGSRVVIAGTASRAVIYRNTLDGKPDYASYDTASSGVHLYGNSFDVVVDGNLFTRMRGGVELWSMGHDGSTEINPVFFNLVVNNVVRDSYDALVAHTMYIHGEIPGAIGQLGNVFRGNVGRGLARAGLHIETWQGFEAGAHLMTVFEDNCFADVRIGVLDARSFLPALGDAAGPRTPVSATILRGNRFIRGNTPPRNSMAFVTRPDSTWLGRRNEWLGFAHAAPPTRLTASPPGSDRRIACPELPEPPR